MRQTGLVSVLMSAYNAEKYVSEAIESVLNQSYRNFELLIADDASTDKTKAVIDSFNDQRIQTFHNKKNLHKNRTINKLFEISSGEFVTIHDADDLSLPFRFEKQVAVLQSRPEVALCGTIQQRMTANGELLNAFRKKEIDFSLIRQSMKKSNTEGDPSMMFRAAVIPGVGGLLREMFKTNEDYDLVLRIMDKFETTNVPEVLYHYRNVPLSLGKGAASPEGLVTIKLVQALADERQKTGTDALFQQNFKRIEELKKEFLQPYQKDKTLHLRTIAGAFLNYKMYGSCLKICFESISREPFKIINWRTFFYCFRKTIFRS